MIAPADQHPGAAAGFGGAEHGGQRPLLLILAGRDLASWAGDVGSAARCQDKSLGVSCCAGCGAAGWRGLVLLLALVGRGR